MIRYYPNEGVSVTGIHTVAFCVAGCFAGIAGALFAQQQTTVSSSLLNWSFSGDVVVMCLVGGMYSFWGPTLGAALYTWLTTAGFAGSANANLYNADPRDAAREDRGRGPA